jgi:hypothetical protein
MVLADEPVRPPQGARGSELNGEGVHGFRERIRFGRRAWAENAQEASDTQSQPDKPRRQRVSICEHWNKGESYHGLSRSSVARNWDAASTRLNVKRTFSGILRL